MQRVFDIINLKEDVGLVEKDATFRKQVRWYHYLLSNGQVEMEYDGDKLVGFIEWVRLNQKPNKREDIYHDAGHADYTKGPIVFVCNSISLKHALYKLRVRAINKVKDAELICWHRKKTGTIKYFKNIRREEHALSQ